MRVDPSHPPRLGVLTSRSFSSSSMFFFRSLVICLRYFISVAAHTACDPCEIHHTMRR
jgi:hypothetical protein